MRLTLGIADQRTNAIQWARANMQTMTDAELLEATYEANATALLIEAVAAGRSLPHCAICGEAIDDPRRAEVFKRSSGTPPMICHVGDCFTLEISRIVSVVSRPGGHALLRGIR